MKFVAFPGSIEHLERLEFEMLKVDAIAACDFFVEAAVGARFLGRCQAGR
jgi:hypothetical protein